MNEKFKRDVYRMTGVEYKRIPIHVWMTQHNIRYMYWWRKVSEHPKNMFAQILLYRISRKFGIEISKNAIVGAGLYLGHPYNITVAGGAVLGNNINLHKGCTIGRENRGKREGTPVLENDIFVGINACIVGNIHIGTDVMIAPNAYVNFDVPSHSIVIGNPAKIISKDNATHGYVNFKIEVD